jgi:hypothetical protein
VGVRSPPKIKNFQFFPAKNVNFAYFSRFFLEISRENIPLHPPPQTWTLRAGPASTQATVTSSSHDIPSALTTITPFTVVSTFIAKYSFLAVILL